MKSSEMRALVEKYIDAYNRMDVPAMLLAVHPDVEFRNISDGSVNASANGIAELRALAEQSLPLFSERRQELVSFEAAEDQAVASIEFQAVVAHDLPNGWKKGQILKLTGRSEFEFRDGTISRITDIS